MTRFTMGFAALALTLTADISSAATRQVFVTSVSGTGKLGDWPAAGAATGLAAGDAICQARAAAGGLDNADGFRAWLSTPSNDAYCRIHGLSGLRASNCGEATLPIDAGPWLRTDDRPFAGAIEDLLRPGLEVFLPPRHDEFGNPVHDRVWTATDSDGESSGYACNGWTVDTNGESVSLGGTDRTGSSWINGFGQNCSATNHLLCFEIGTGEPLPSFANWGRLAFVTSAQGTGDLGSWDEAGPATGLAAGDAICQSLATTADLPNASSFKAWLSSDAVDAVDRFDHDGPWMRLDRVRVADDLAGLTDGFLNTAIALTDTGEYLGLEGVWTGTDETGAAAGNNCENWTTGSLPDSGRYGIADSADLRWSTYLSTDVACDYQFYRLYCLQDLPLIFGDGFESHSTTVWSLATP